MDSALAKYILLAFIASFGAGCIAMLVIAGMIHWHIFFYAFFPDYVSAPSIIILSSSCLLLLAAALGVYGVFKDKNWMLKVFAGALGALLVLQLIGGVIALSMEETLNDPLKSIMLETQDKYNTSSSDRNIWDDVQREYYCCGVDSYLEWADIFGINNSVPQSCNCRIKEEPCIRYGDKDIYELGCFPRLRDYVHNLEIILGALAISFIAFEMLSIVAAFLVTKSNGIPTTSGDC